MSDHFNSLPPRTEGGVFISNFWLLIVLGVVLLCVTLYTPTPVTGVDSGLKWLGAHRYASSGSLSITSPNFTFLPMPPLVPAPYVVVVDRNLLPVYPILPMVVNGYLIRWLGEWSWRLLSLLPALLMGWLLLKQSRAIQISAPLALALLFTGTPLLFYATSYWEHALAAALAVSGVVMLTQSASKLAWFIAGVLLGIAPWVRPEIILWSIAALLFAPLRFPRRFILIAGFALSITAGALLNWSHTGFLLPLQVIANFSTRQTLFTGFTNAHTVRSWWNLLFGAGEWYVSVVILLCGVVGWLGRKKLPALQWTFIAAILIYLFTRWLDSAPVLSLLRSNGFVITFPILFISLFGWKSLPHKRVWGAASIGLLLATLLMGDVGNGVHWGARFLLPLAFPLAISAAIALRESAFTRMWKQIFIASLTLLGLYSLQLQHSVANRVSALQRELSQATYPVITDVPWLGGDASTVYADHPVGFASGDREIAQWLVTAKAEQTSHFHYVRFRNAPLLTIEQPKWSKLISLVKVDSLPAFDRDMIYRNELYEVIGDSLSYSKLAGELAALHFSEERDGGVQFARKALEWNPNDLRPAIALVAYGMQRNRERWTADGLQAIASTHQPIDKKYRELIERGYQFVNRQSTK